MLKTAFLYIFIATAIYTTAYTENNEQHIQINNHKLSVEIAETEKEHKKGLMFRKTLKENKGMLFIFKKAKYLSFWMKNTYIPLDIGFFDENKKLIEYKSMIPLSLDIIRSSEKAKYALEVNKNWFSKHNIKIGSTLKILATRN